MKTQEEILAKFAALEGSSEDFFGHQKSDLIDFLTFENAKKFLKPEVTEAEWKPKETTPEAVIAVIKDYMEFAWEKANNCRGLSADRSISHMTIWLWLLGDEELQKKFDDTEYEHYGKEKLIVICDHLGIDWKQYDNGVRTNTDI